jgi:hypothetical protein
MIVLGALLAIGFVGYASAADDATPKNPRYVGLPNLTDAQKAKIAAIEKQADEQVMAVLSPEQKAAMTAQDATAAAPAGSGLYAAEAKSKTSGAIKSRDYWEAKFNADQLEMAIKDHEPEGAIGLMLVSVVHLLDDLSKDYPNHVEVKAWRTRAVQVQKMIGDNFNRRETFKPDCLWSNDSYMQSYVGFNTAKTAMADKDYDLAFMMSQLAKQKVNYLTESEEHMEHFSPEAKAYIIKIKPELTEIYQTSGKATHHF